MIGGKVCPNAWTQVPLTRPSRRERDLRSGNDTGLLRDALLHTAKLLFWEKHSTFLVFIFLCCACDGSERFLVFAAHDQHLILERGGTAEQW